MKRSFVLGIVLVTALGATIWRSDALRARVTDARPEAVAMGGTLLALASILRRNAPGPVK